MKKSLPTALTVFSICSVQLAAQAGQDEFCVGFTEGYKSVKGDMVIVPICPVAPVTLIGSTDFREGIKAGIRATRGG